MYAQPRVVPRSRTGLGAASTSSVASSTGSGASIGATVGTTIFPAIGTVVGGVVGGVVGLAVGLFQKGGSVNPNAVAITNKWYNWYLGRPADASGAAWWPNQINADGVANAWMNFSTSAEPVQKGASQMAALYQSLGYGGPTDPPPAGTNPLIAPPTNQPYVALLAPPPTSVPIYATPAPASAPTPVQVLTNAGMTPQQIASLTPAQVASAAAQLQPQQASILGGMSTTTLLLLGGGILAAFLLTQQKGRRT